MINNKQYKSDEAIVAQPHLREPLFRNYDLYETEGVDGKAKHSPGTGYNNLNQFKSIKEFRDAKKKNTDKYVAEDSYKQDDGSIIKKKRSERRLALLYALGIDFPGQELTYNTDNPQASSINPYGGITDQYTQSVDFDGKTNSNLNYGQEKDYPNDISELSEEDMDKLLNSAEPPFLGMDDTTDSREDLETNIPSGEPRHGKTYNGNHTFIDEKFAQAKEASAEEIKRAQYLIGYFRAWYKETYGKEQDGGIYMEEWKKFLQSKFALKCDITSETTRDIDSKKIIQLKLLWNENQWDPRPDQIPQEVRKPTKTIGTGGKMTAANTGDLATQDRLFVWENQCMAKKYTKLKDGSSWSENDIDGQWGPRSREMLNNYMNWCNRDHYNGGTRTEANFLTTDVEARKALAEEFPIGSGTDQPTREGFRINSSKINKLLKLANYLEQLIF